MAKLKLMKKEWFNWFYKTFLDNITAWTEYYYINPDSQHWISNNLIDIDDVPQTIRDSITYSFIDGVLKWKGASDKNYGTNAWFALKKPIPAGTTISLKAWGDLARTGLSLGKLNSYGDLISMSPDRTIVAPYDITHLRIGTGYNEEFDVTLKPMAVFGPVIPEAFSPSLIKIEDVIEVIDLGDLDWSIPNATGWVQSVYISDLRGYDTTDMPKVFCDKLPTRTPNQSYHTDYSISAAGVEPKSRLIMRMPEFIGKTQSEVKQMVKGWYAVYVKASSPL